ncbi:hypothetical protein FRC09_006131 [Ceratobasidium sp. 395]|nr:hypothetical protein FRC09_006131 [Ceratobasidium sp. 395]
MTNAERAKSRRIKRSIKRGEKPKEVMTPRAPSNRSGLRDKQYAYSNKEPPKIVRPHKNLNTDTTEEVSVPHLPNHGDLSATSNNDGSSHNYYVLSSRPKSPVPDDNQGDQNDQDETESQHTTPTDVDSDMDASYSSEGKNSGNSKQAQKAKTATTTTTTTTTQQPEQFRMLSMLAEQAVVKASVRDNSLAAHTTHGHWEPIDADVWGVSATDRCE